jgi:hypothetical protein
LSHGSSACCRRRHDARVGCTAAPRGPCGGAGCGGDPGGRAARLPAGTRGCGCVDRAHPAAAATPAPAPAAAPAAPSLPPAAWPRGGEKELGEGGLWLGKR